MKAVLNKVNELSLENKVAIVTVTFITFLAVSVFIETVLKGTSL